MAKLYKCITTHENGTQEQNVEAKNAKEAEAIVRAEFGEDAKISVTEMET